MKKSIKFEHQPRNDGDLKKDPVLYIFMKASLKDKESIYKYIRDVDAKRIEILCRRI